MPKCDGLPDGHCPQNRNDNTVSVGEGDLMLCASCDAERHKQFLASRQKAGVGDRPRCTDKSAEVAREPAHQPKPTATRSARNAGGSKPAAAGTPAAATIRPGEMSSDSAVASDISSHVTSRQKAGCTEKSADVAREPSLQPKSTATKSARNAGGSKPAAVGTPAAAAIHPGETSSDSVVASDISSHGKQLPATAGITDGVVFNELLMYVNYFRNRSATESLRKVIASFYNSNEIAAAKRLLSEIAISKNVLTTDCGFLAERRNSLQRSACGVEVEDIMGLFNVLDSRDLLCDTKFVALAYDRLPRYGPEELNVCAVVDRQLDTENKILNLSSRVESFISDTNLVAVNKISDLSAKIDSLMSSIQLPTMAPSVPVMDIDSIKNQLAQLTTICSHQQSTRVSPAAVVEQQSRPLDRTRNIIIHGIPENRDVSIWRSKIVEVLQVTTGHDVPVDDAFRLGRFEAGQIRPILVKLHSAWNRRIVLSGSHNLSQVDGFNRVFLSADEPLDVRRRNTLERLKNRANREGRNVSVVAGKLSVDGVDVYSVDLGNLSLGVRNGSSTVH